jgi:hypothetical protein
MNSERGDAMRRMLRPGGAVLCLALLVGTATWSAPPRHFPAPSRTADYLFVYGTLRLDGQPAQPGVEVAVFSAAGVLCGTGCVETAGRFPAIAVYRDDAGTPPRDGAEAGEELRFRVWDVGTHSEVPAEPIVSAVADGQRVAPHPLTWTWTFDLVQVDLVVRPQADPR